MRAPSSWILLSCIIAFPAAQGLTSRELKVHVGIELDLLPRLLDTRHELPSSSPVVLFLIRTSARVTDVLDTGNRSSTFSFFVTQRAFSIRLRSRTPLAPHPLTPAGTSGRNCS